jgi:hypothetical protein
MEDLDEGVRPPDANPAAIAIVYLVSAYPSAERERAEQTAGRLREIFPNVRVVAVFLPGMSIQPGLAPHIGNAHRTVSSFVEAAQVRLEQQGSEAA